MRLAKLITIFLIINFAGLYVGNLLMDNGPTGNWYLNLNKAPWTPPGWVFGAAWTTIMVCFSVYLGFLFKDFSSSFLKVFYAVQVLLNVSWNYVFFNQQWVYLGLIVIIALFIVILYFFTTYQMDAMRKIRFLLLPYLIWLSIAISLNMYIAIHN